jgi:hypothetical protein
MATHAADAKQMAAVPGNPVNKSEVTARKIATVMG